MSLETRIRSLVTAGETDLTSSGLRAEVGVFDLRRTAWVTRELGAAPSDFAGGRFVLTLPGRQQSLPDEEAGGSMLIAVVDQVADWVMDETGHGWPELVDEKDGFVALLTPAMTDGRATWVGGGLSVPVGSLSSVRIAAVTDAPTSS